MSTPRGGGGRFRAYLEFILAVVYFFMARILARHWAHGLVREQWSPLLEQAMLAFLLLAGYAALGSWLDRAKAEALGTLKLPAVRDPMRIPPGASIAHLVLSALLLFWWAGSLGFRTVFEVAGARITLAPSWAYFVGGLALVLLAHAVLSGVNLFRPRWTRARSAVRLAIDCAGAVLFCWLLKAGILQEVFVAAATKARTAGIVDAAYVGISNTFPFAVLVCAWIILVDVCRVFRARPV